MAQKNRYRIHFMNVIRLITIISFISSTTLTAQKTTAQHGHRVASLVIFGGIMVDGVGTPAEGPVDIVIRNDRIERIARSSEKAKYMQSADAVIDARGKYVLPGFINMHNHIHAAPAGVPQSLQYQFNLWLGAGITTNRLLGGRAKEVRKLIRQSESGEIAAPRIIYYAWFPGGKTEDEIRSAVRRIKASGATGMKCWGIDRDTFRIAADEARKLGLQIAHHVGVEDANALDDADMGTTTIEHWYGIPDAALDGVQSFPADFNHADELDRFRYAGRLWREVDQEKLRTVLRRLVEKGVAWDPTFAIYEASRDLQRALTNPAFADYLHPALKRFFTPSPEHHGSFFAGWSNTDEVYWKENYAIWMRAVRDFERLGGVVTTGEDAGYIYQIYGFAYLRELQLHEEAGFHPLEVIRHATYNGARALGMEHEIGRIKAGFSADLIVVDGNPLANLQILLPQGLNPVLDQQRDGHGGIEWTIKQGFTYHAPTLFKQAREIVRETRKNLAEQ